MGKPKAEMSRPGPGKHARRNRRTGEYREKRWLTDTPGGQATLAAGGGVGAAALGALVVTRPGVARALRATRLRGQRWWGQREQRNAALRKERHRPRRDAQRAERRAAAVERKAALVARSKPVDRDQPGLAEQVVMAKRAQGGLVSVDKRPLAMQERDRARLERRMKRLERGEPPEGKAAVWLKQTRERVGEDLKGRLGRVKAAAGAKWKEDVEKMRAAMNAFDSAEDAGEGGPVFYFVREDRFGRQRAGDGTYAAQEGGGGAGPEAMAAVYGRGRKKRRRRAESLRHDLPVEAGMRGAPLARQGASSDAPGENRFSAFPAFAAFAARKGSAGGAGEKALQGPPPRTDMVKRLDNWREIAGKEMKRNRRQGILSDLALGGGAAVAGGTARKAWRGGRLGRAVGMGAAAAGLGTVAVSEHVRRRKHGFNLWRIRRELGKHQHGLMERQIAAFSAFSAAGDAEGAPKKRRAKRAKPTKQRVKARLQALDAGPVGMLADSGISEAVKQGAMGTARTGLKVYAEQLQPAMKRGMMLKPGLRLFSSKAGSERSEAAKAKERAAGRKFVRDNLAAGALWTVGAAGVTTGAAAAMRPLRRKRNAMEGTGKVAGFRDRAQDEAMRRNHAALVRGDAKPVAPRDLAAAKLKRWERREAYRKGLRREARGRALRHPAVLGGGVALALGGKLYLRAKKNERERSKERLTGEGKA